MHRGAAGATPSSTGDLRVGILSLELHPEDRTMCVLQADLLIEISDQVLEHADDHYVSVGDGIVTFHSRHGDLSYGLRAHDDIREVWLAVRSDVAAEDLDEGL